jgi:putative inorganic carbon (HCO3(-)) transporter
VLLILIYIALVIIRPQEYPSLVDAQLPILSVALAVATLPWLAGAKDFSLPQYKILFAFFLVTLISRASNGWFGGVPEQASLFAPTVLAFVLIANALTTQKRIVALMWVMVLCSCVLAIYGVDQAQNGIGWTGLPLVQEDGRIQYVGIFNDPNDLGLLFVAVLPMAVYLSSRGGWLGLIRLFWLAAAALILYGIVLTDSRGAMLAVGSMVGAWLWLRRGLFTAATVVGVGMAGLMMLPSRLQELDAGEESAAGRVEAWYEGLLMFQSRPVFGVGAGNFTEHYFLTAHNSFVLVLAETGYIGFTLWLAFIGYCFWMMLTLSRYKPVLADPAAEKEWASQRAIGTTMLVSLCGFFTAAFFLSRTYVIILYFVAAICVGTYATARSRYPDLREFRIEGDIGRWFGISFAGVIFLYVLVKVLL